MSHGSSGVCRCQTCALQQRLDLMNIFIKSWKWLLDSYVSDFFVRELWNQVPTEWWQVLSESDPEELAALLSLDTWRVRRVWPLSLIAHRYAILNLCLERHPQTHPEQDVTQDFAVDGQCLYLEHCYRRHVKPKKQHEIQQLAKTIRDICSAVQSRHVIDIGAGQGHLSRLLTYGYRLSVTTIEASGCHMPKATKYDSEVEKDLKNGRVLQRSVKKKLNNLGATQDEDLNSTHASQNMFHSLSAPKHLVAWIEPDISVVDFLSRIEHEHTSHCQMEHDTEQIQEAGDITETYHFKNGSSSDSGNSYGPLYRKGSCVEEETNFVMTGLHACGDLSSTMLRVFVKCPRAVALASVACCYMKLSSTDSSTGDVVGYPMSDYLLQQQQPVLSWEARELACHFADAYHDRLLENGESLQSHVYRAALQEIIMAKSTKCKHESVKLSFKKAHTLGFVEYASVALKRLGLDPVMLKEQLEKAKSRLSQWKQVVVLYVLRLSLAPLLESVILLDRMLFLIENGVLCKLVPVFNPRISPRNFVLIASKLDSYPEKSLNSCDTSKAHK